MKKGYTSLGYTSEEFDNYWSNANLRSWRPRVKIYDHDGDTLLHDYNPFSSTNDINIEYVECQELLGNTGNFTLRIRDDERSIDRSKVGNANKVVIQMSQQDADWKNLSSGYVENIQVSRNRKDGLKFTLAGFGSGIIIQETLSSFRKAAYPIRFGSSKPDVDDPNMKVYNLVKAVLRDTDHLVSSKVSTKENGGFGIDTLISEDVDVFLPEINTKYPPQGQTINFLNQRAGNIWGVNASDKVWMWYPGSKHCGVTLKTFKAKEKISDYACITSYFFGPWDYSMPIN